MKYRFHSLLMMLFVSGAAQEGPGTVIAHPGQDVELLCNITGGVQSWRVNGTTYTSNQLFMGELAGHNNSLTGPNIIVEYVMMNDNRNGSIYICVIPQTPPAQDIESDPTILLVAGIPAMVPNVIVDDNTVNINGNNVTLTLNWGEPFNGLVPIVNYTVSCSGDVTCPPATTDNTTRSYNITNLIPMTDYTFSVVATNSIGSGEDGVVMITTPAISQVTGVTLTCEPVGLINQCTVMWEPVTHGDITGYQVCYNGTTENVNGSTITLTFIAPSLPDGMFTGTVVVMVTAINQYGVGPASPSSADINVTFSVIIATPMLMCTPVASQLYNITVTCTIHPGSTADQCVVMAMADDRMTRTGTARITNRMATVTISDLQCGVIYNITAEGALNGALVGPGSPHGVVAAGPCPVIATTVDDESDDDLSTGAAVIISIVVTFIITIVVTALISVIITSLYYRRHYIKKSLIRQEGNSHALTEDIKSNDPAAYATTRANITMDTNPAYGTATTIKMDTNPAYAATSH